MRFSRADAEVRMPSRMWSDCGWTITHISGSEEEKIEIDGIFRKVGYPALRSAKETNHFMRQFLITKRGMRALSTCRLFSVG